MTAVLYVAEVAVVVAGVVGMLWLRHQGDRAWVVGQAEAAWAEARRVRMDLVIDATPFAVELRKAAASAERLIRTLAPRRPCGCPELAEHDRACPDHPANQGIRSRVRWHSRRLASRWHRWRVRRLTYAADRHDWASHSGNWRSNR